MSPWRQEYNGYGLSIDICHFGHSIQQMWYIHGYKDISLIRKDVHLDTGWSFLLKQCFRSLL